MGSLQRLEGLSFFAVLHCEPIGNGEGLWDAPGSLETSKNEFKKLSVESCSRVEVEAFRKEGNTSINPHID